MDSISTTWSRSISCKRRYINFIKRSDLYLHLCLYLYLFSCPIFHCRFYQVAVLPFLWQIFTLPILSLSFLPFTILSNLYCWMVTSDAHFTARLVNASCTCHVSLRCFFSVHSTLTHCPATQCLTEKNVYCKHSRCHDEAYDVGLRISQAVSMPFWTF